MTSHILPDNPDYAFCPACDLGDEPQQIRIVIDGMAGNVPPRFCRQPFAWTASYRFYRHDTGVYGLKEWGEG